MTLGKPITGEVILDFVREERLKLVTITVIGVLSFVQAEQVTFFKQSQTLWDSTMGDPRSPTTPSSHRPNTPPENQPQQQLQNVKVHGTYTFPFSVQIPRQSTLSANASTLKEFRLPVDKNTLSLLPPSYDGKPWHISVNYAMTIRVKKGGAFSTESKLKIPIEYSPSSAPDPPSLLRQSTYNEKRPPPPQATGPELDPEGWTTMPSTEFSGVAFRRRNVTVNCSLSFARPLAYTRGSYIPLMLSLRSTDAQTLDILSSPPPPVSSTYHPSSTPSSSKPSQDHSLNVHLTRTVIEGENLEFSRPFFVNHDMPTLLVVDRLPPIASAVWRRVESGIVQSNSSPSETEGPSSSRRPDPIHERVLFGEIKLPTDLTPSFTFGKIQLVYSVDMRPPSVPGFVPSDEAPISQTEVMIHPCFAEGPRPQSSV